MQFTVQRFTSTPHSPSVHGLHPIASFHALQVEQLVQAQHAKRRGGPKKVWLALRVIDQMGRPLSSHVVVWKTITQKNFSNQQNIIQYQRNPFGSMRLETADAEGGALQMVIHGAATGSKIANAVGVNIAGKGLESHPRFLLSSGKGAEGARTAFLFYHSDPNARIQLQRVWIEHKELKITFEQEEGAPMLEFASNFKTTYAAKKESSSEEEAEDKMEVLEAKPEPAAAAAAAAIPPVVKAAPASKSTRAGAKWTSELNVSLTAPILAEPAAASMPAAASSSASGASKKLRALPPVAIPAAVAERLLKRKRSSQSLDSPVASNDDSSLASLPLIKMEPADEEESDALPAAAAGPQLKKLFSEQSQGAAAAAFPLFLGFDAGFDAFSLQASGSQEDMELSFSDDQLTSEVKQQEVDQATPQHEDDDATPRLNSDSTPPPFLHQLTGNSSGSDGAVEEDQLTMMSQVLEDAENAEDKYELRNSLTHLDPYGQSLDIAPYLRPKREGAAAAAADSNAIPMEIATATVKNNPFHFTAFSPQPAQPRELSPNFGSLSLSSGLDLLRSPFQFDPTSPLSGLMHSPLSPHALDLTMACRQAAAAAAQRNQAQRQQLPQPQHSPSLLLVLPTSTPLVPVASTPLRSPSA